jgi:hypothetical protein
MEKEFLIIHTPGTFGNFIAYLIDSYQQGQLLEEPFKPSGNSHGRKIVTESIDVVIPGKWKEYEKKCLNKTVIGCIWQTEYFPYILHAYYSRTNSGQYGECGVKFAENNFYDFINAHAALDRMKENIVHIKNLFNFDINKTNKKVPRHILRMFFWFCLFNQNNNIATLTNQEIKNLKKIKQIDIMDIMDYKKLKFFMEEEFHIDLNFKEIHEKFLKNNKSLQDYIQANAIIDAVKTNKNIEIAAELSIVGEATIFYELERHYFDIPFFNLFHFFKNTADIIEYIKYYPHHMRQPNKLYHQHYKKFPNPYGK